MKLSGTLLTTALFFSITQTALAETRVYIQDKSISFTVAPRLNEVLTHLPSEQFIYFPTVALFKQSEALVSLQSKVVNDLRQLAGLQQANQAGSVATALAKEIESWQIAERSNVSVFYERARLVPSLNPRLSNGVFYLAVAPRSERLAVFGATNNNAIAFKFEQAIAEIYSASALSIADNSFIWVIEPDGTSRKVGVAYWNKQKDLSRPGQQFFIPFASSVLPSHLQDLNSNIVSLLRHRVISA